IGARTSFLVTLPDGQRRDVLLGDRTLALARSGKQVTVDGRAAEGDVEGAPPTAQPATLVVGEVAAAKLLAAQRIPGDPTAATARVQLQARWPSCAGTPLG